MDQQPGRHAEPFVPDDQRRPSADTPPSARPVTAMGAGAEEIPSPAVETPVVAPRPEPQVIELREEQLVANKSREFVGEVVVRTELEDVPAALDADVSHDEVVVERVPVNQVVDQRMDPWEEDGARVIPIYEEQIVLTRRLVLKEKVRVHRQPVSEQRHFEGMVRRERLVVDKPDYVVVRERLVNSDERRPNELPPGASPDGPSNHAGEDQNLLDRVARKIRS